MIQFHTIGIGISSIGSIIYLYCNHQLIGIQIDCLTFLGKSAPSQSGSNVPSFQIKTAHSREKPANSNLQNILIN